ncbi:DNA recombination protein RmuC [Prevotella nigrescens]|uniref:DNA recombination protein RmuC n=1 Tax=Prevotella nigrescens TaxID=28133 RepID=UPI0002184597|nr:DNA recombination protein RmuC [Prevotella nigrescens]EGQ17818.1 RmuC domain protein [Prevotella nigrescens ATCC 33563]UAK28960.1 DNA recombination protein RmuC [Prevotella nigrescens]WMS21914.1 DNA recombination protein RmuC [Prevotella nigrescens]SUB91904.1 DNA recombination protein rmuC [Prevotella nigrescens]
MAFLYFFSGLFLGALLVFLWTRSQVATTAQKLSADLAVAKSQLEAAQKNAADSVNAEREHSQKLLIEMQKQMETSKKLMQEEMRTMAAQMLSESREHLNAADKERLDALLKPLHERIEAFNQNVTAATKEGASNKTEIKTTFEETIKLLQEVQTSTVKSIREDNERAIKELRQQTERIGNDAASLTQALKGDTKMQGDWGEMILETTLESCGLTKNEQFFLQRSYQDAKGNSFRPDAVIDLPGGEHAVIDAKVSLTAYQAAVNATDAIEQELFLKEHIKSIKKHIDELSAKNYETIVPNCIGYVLMFVPYESGYAAAIKTDPSILQYAYRKHIILLSPSNLLMALQLTRTMWQNYRMNKNVEEILRASNDLYDKFVSFGETFLKIGTGIQRLQSDYEKAHSQLSEGKGNIVRRLDNMKMLGITPKKELPEGL